MSSVIARAALAVALATAAPAAAQEPQGELTFTFCTSSAPCVAPTGLPFTDEEVATLRTQLSVYYPLAKALYGNPFADATIEYCKMNLQGDATGVAGATFIGVRDTRPTIVVHEMLHAFHSFEYRAIGIFEEGMAEAGAVLVTSLACATQDCTSGPFAAYRLFHGGMGQVYYDGENVPEMFSPLGSFPGNGTWNTHYRLADYAFSKIEIERPGFLRAFNALYFAQATDAASRGDVAFLASIARSLAPTVEGQDFDAWFAAQHVFDTVPLPGPGIAQLRDVRNEFSPPDQYLTAFLWGADLHSVPDATLGWTVFDDGEQPIATGTDVTDASGRIAVRFPDGYVGSARLEVAGGGAASSQFWPIAPAPAGVFGVVPHASGGTVEVALDGSSDAPTVVPVTAGYFTAPSLEPLAGRFRLTYRTPGGGTAIRVFTKDTSRYFVLVKLPDLVTSPPDGAPARLLAGDSFQAAASIANAGVAASPASQVRFFLSTDAVRDAADLPVATALIPALETGGAAVASAVATVPAATPAGTYHLLACANDPEVFAETTWANDCAASASTIAVAPRYTADVLPPIRADGTSTFNGSRGALPIKFSLRVGGEPSCALPPATLEVARLGAGNAETLSVDLVEMQSDDGAAFRISDCQYVYNLAASALGPGTYRTSIRVAGNIAGSATFTLR